jgi:hypothetical protein
MALLLEEVIGLIDRDVGREAANQLLDQRRLPGPMCAGDSDPHLNRQAAYIPAGVPGR